MPGRHARGLAPLRASEIHWRSHGTLRNPFASSAPPLSDTGLVEQLRGGSRDAFELIFRTYYPRLVGLAQTLLGERAAAEEVAQEVMFELWKRRLELRVETTLQAYLYRATRNRALNQLRHERVVRAAEPLLADAATRPAAADARVREREVAAAVQAAVATLPERCREVFELSRVHGLGYAEIASVMGISVKTVEAQMGKALRVLRERLAPFV